MRHHQNVMTIWKPCPVLLLFLTETLLESDEDFTAPSWPVLYLFLTEASPESDEEYTDQPWPDLSLSQTWDMTRKRSNFIAQPCWNPQRVMKNTLISHGLFYRCPRRETWPESDQTSLLSRDLFYCCPRPETSPQSDDDQCYRTQPRLILLSRMNHFIWSSKSKPKRKGSDEDVYVQTNDVKKKIIYLSIYLSIYIYIYI